jgi:hypothetical protein
VQSKSRIEEAGDLGFAGGKKEGAKDAAEEDLQLTTPRAPARSAYLFNGRDGQVDRGDLELLVVDGEVAGRRRGTISYFFSHIFLLHFPLKK